MKIAILSATFSQFSGIDRVVARQAEDLARQGHQVTIMALRADMPAQTVSVQELGMPSSLIAQRVFRLLLPLFFWRVNNYLNKLKEFEVIYSHQYPMNYLAAKAKQKYGAKYIYYNHGVAPSWTFSNWWEKIYIKKFNWLTNQSIKPANQIISISNYLQQVLKKETRRDSQVVYDQIDTKRFHPGIDGSQIRQQYQISQDPLILYVGRLSPHKGIDLLIEAFNQVRKQLPSAKLLIVGKPTFATYQNKLKAMADQSVIFADFVDDAQLPQYYAASDLYATASLWEGFDLPLAEAQACGKHVVAFDIGPHPEIINPGGVLVPVKDVGAMAEAIIAKLKTNE